MSEAGNQGATEVVPPSSGGGDETRRQHLRLMGFAVSLALLVVLAPPWLMVLADGHAVHRLYSGISLIEVFGGVVVTIVIMLTDPNGTDPLTGQTDQVAFTGAPIIAVGLWLVAVVVALAGWSTARASS
ncbi:hypothetical protein GCM10009804_03400 [Kribbella hippodromi]|uniref:Uncharacterized protein n=1 Tax=Kribbella hippodromi TaxID=434347 RepID=A0ABN2C2M5_9ACTN